MIKSTNMKEISKDYLKLIDDKKAEIEKKH